MGAKKRLTRVYKAGRVRRWKDPGATRMLAMLQQAIDEGRSFTLEVSADGAMRVELGPKLTRLVHVATRRKAVRS